MLNSTKTPINRFLDIDVFFVQRNITGYEITVNSRASQVGFDIYIKHSVYTSL
jgi:hypothetical protein